MTIDIDDTLITDEKIVTEATKSALKEAAAQGVVVTLATGRMFASAKNVARQLELDVPIITYQGSLVKNLIDEQVLYERSLPRDAAQLVFEYAKKHHLHLQVYHNDELYAAQENQRLIDYCNLSNVPYKIEPNIEILAAKPLTKAIIIDEPDYLDQIAPELKKMLGPDVHVTKSKPHFLEFIHKEGTKGHAVEYLAHHFGCDLSEVIAIGDSWNDHDMIEKAGLGVAMDNAVPALKEIADFITKSNNDDGVKHVIDTFILSAKS